MSFQVEEMVEGEDPKSDEGGLRVGGVLLSSEAAEEAACAGADALVRATQSCEQRHSEADDHGEQSADADEVRAYRAKDYPSSEPDDTLANELVIGTVCLGAEFLSSGVDCGVDGVCVHGDLQ